MKRFFVLGKSLLLAGMLFAGLSLTTSCGDDEEDDPKPVVDPNQNGGNENKDPENKDPENKDPENKDPEKDPNSGEVQKSGTCIQERDYTKLADSDERFWGDDWYKSVFVIDENGLTMNVTEGTFHQFLVLDHFNDKCKPNTDYHLYTTVNASVAGKFMFHVGNWSASDPGEIPFEAGEKTYTSDFTASNLTKETGEHVWFGVGEEFVGTYSIKYVGLYMEEE